MDWEKRMESLWMDYLFWMRYYIFSLMLQRQDIAYVAARTLRNASDFAQTFSALYGPEAAKRMEEFMTQHILLLAQMTATMNAGQDYAPLREEWYRNAEDLSGFLAEMNPYWDKVFWYRLLRYRYEMEENLISKLNGKDYETAVTQYDAAFGNAQQMMEYMLYGLQQQFEWNV